MVSLRILAIDDFEPWRKFVRFALQERPDLRNISGVSDGVEAVQKAQELQPDLILLDISLPRLNGIEVGRQIRLVAPKAKILFLTENDDTNVAEQAFLTGASGYVIKSDAVRELFPAIDAIMDGKRFVSERLRGGHAFDFERWQAAN
jgi:DNA-binding NarL/FixJ family response regulator